MQGEQSRIPALTSQKREAAVRRNKMSAAITPAKIRAMITLGVPYPKDYDQQANADLFAQASKIQAGLKKEKLETNYIQIEILQFFIS